MTIACATMVESTISEKLKEQAAILTKGSSGNDRQRERWEIFAA